MAVNTWGHTAYSIFQALFGLVCSISLVSELRSALRPSQVPACDLPGGVDVAPRASVSQSLLALVTATLPEKISPSFSG